MFSPFNSYQSLRKNICVAVQYMSLYYFTVGVCYCTYTRKIFIDSVQFHSFDSKSQKWNSSLHLCFRLIMKNWGFFSLNMKWICVFGF